MSVTIIHTSTDTLTASVRLWPRGLKGAGTACWMRAGDTAAGNVGPGTPGDNRRGQGGLDARGRDWTGTDERARIWAGMTLRAGMMPRGSITGQALVRGQWGHALRGA